MIITLLNLVRHTHYLICFTSISWIHEFILLDDVWDLPYARILRAVLACTTNTHADISSKAEECCAKLLLSVG